MTSEGTLETIIAQQHGNKPVEYLSSNYKGRVYVTSKASLSFMDVKVDDTGRYGCKLLTFGDATISNSTISEVSGRRLFFSLSWAKFMPIRHRAERGRLITQGVASSPSSLFVKALLQNTSSSLHLHLLSLISVIGIVLSSILMCMVSTWHAN